MRVDAEQQHERLKEEVHDLVGHVVAPDGTLGLALAQVGRTESHFNNFLCVYRTSWGDSLRVAWEQGCVADVVQPEVEEHDTLESEGSPTVREGSIPIQWGG